jgi:hypothetical protein
MESSSDAHSQMFRKLNLVEGCSSILTEFTLHTFFVGTIFALVPKAWACSFERLISRGNCQPPKRGTKFPPKITNYIPRGSFHNIMTKLPLITADG